MALTVGQQQSLPLDVLHVRHEAEGTARQVVAVLSREVLRPMP